MRSSIESWSERGDDNNKQVVQKHHEENKGCPIYRMPPPVDTREHLLVLTTTHVTPLLYTL